ncbi:uncharacterized protein TNCV_2560861 [Trichonephila clavipes]|uniref:Mutator-like transposase domain-containing protein n=1 Tax=Trichonephila clavipes TaxID=2585209 RepID=A0A8X6UY64_TRICX|nr:uncharacterized protein TNCV_2560861 [Trichonephila clavipes]
MEVKAAEILWKRCIKNCGMRYVSILSDGDAKTYQHLSSLNVYGNCIKIAKEECINHVAKRLGTGFRNKISEWRNKGITIGGRKEGNLKENTIVKLTNFYRKAIKDNAPRCGYNFGCFNSLAIENNELSAVSVDISHKRDKRRLAQSEKKNSSDWRKKRISNKLAKSSKITKNIKKGETYGADSRAFNKKDTKMYEVNTRLAYAMRSVGKGEAAAKVFCGVMNLPPPPKWFYQSLHALNNATERVAKVSMALAAAETLSFNNCNPNVPVAIDGTWQKRGHTSLNGVVTVVSVDTGKVVDAEILSRKCSCHFNGSLHSDVCSANYFGNSGGMEVEAYKAVLESKPCKDVNVEKLECVVHVEKRMGTRLRALKLKLKGKKLEDKKSLGGCNRLTDAETDKLQRYYGLAIRNNSGNLSAMKQAIWAIFFHKISTDLNPQHCLCPLGDDSWCGYNRSKLKGDTYKHKHNLPIAIMHCIKKVFRDLSSPELMSRSLHGKTQNCNESLNSVIWSIIPKIVFVQLGTLKTGVYESISIYNQGLVTKLKVLDLLNIQPGFYTCPALQEADHARIRKVEKAISRRAKEARIKNRQLKCRQEDDLADDPSNPSYGSGMY